MKKKKKKKSKKKSDVEKWIETWPEWERKAAEALLRKELPIWHD